MEDRTFLRYGGYAAVAGAIAIAIANLFHPRYGAASFEDPARYLADIHAAGGWEFVHGALFLSNVLILVGLYAIASSIRTEPGRTWARIAKIVVVVGAAAGVAHDAVDFMLGAVAAEVAAGDMSVGVGALASSLGIQLFAVWIFLVLGVVQGLIGLAIVNSEEYARWPGFVLLLGAVAGAVQSVIAGLVNQQTPLTQWVLLPLASVPFTLWLAYTGWRLVQANPAEAVAGRPAAPATG